MRKLGETGMRSGAIFIGLFFLIAGVISLVTDDTGPDTGSFGVIVGLFLIGMGVFYDWKEDDKPKQ